MPTLDLGQVVGPQGPQGATGPQGPQGVKGEQAPVINDLTTGGVTDALSAEMGKQLENTKADLTLSNLSNYQKALRNIGGRPNRNLLDNWYFVGGGSQQGGGQFPVNQRGQTSYSEEGNVFDRFKKVGSPASLALVPDGIKMTWDQVGGIMLRQVMDNPARFSRQIVTISALISQFDPGTTNSLFLRLRINNQNWNPNAIHITAPGLYQKTVQCPDDVTNLFWEIGGNDGACTICAGKLEFGATQTLAYQDEEGSWQLFETPDYGEELAKCQRYQLVLSSTDSNSPVGSGVVHTTTQARIVIPLPNTLRIKPTLSYSGSFQLLTNGVGATITRIALESINQNCISIQATSSGLVVGQAAILRSNNDVNAKIILDANL